MAYLVGPSNAPDQYGNDVNSGVCAYQVGLAVRCDFTIQNNPIYYCLLEPGGSWLPEKYLPGLSNAISFVSLDRLTVGVRFRNVTPGQIAVVTAELIFPWDMDSTYH